MPVTDPRLRAFAGMHTIAEIGSIVGELPRPLGGWHAWTPEIAAVAADLVAAADAVASVPEAAAELDALIGEEAPGVRPAPGTAFGAARERLAALARPDGRHPYLNLIVRALEAGERLYDVLARHPRAAAAFAEQERRAA